jgi:hypothetical protein
VKICEVVVKRDATTNEIKNAFLNWENNYVADDILNYARHDELADRETFTTRMVQRVDLCQPHNLYDDVQWTNGAWYDNREIDDVNGTKYGAWPANNRWANGNNVFYHAYVQHYDHSFYLRKSDFRVKFLRPINLDPITVKFVDARLNNQNVAQGDRAYLTEFKDKLTDWRDMSFYSTDYRDGIAADGRDYFRYYGALDGVADVAPEYGTRPEDKKTGDMLPKHFTVFTSSAFITTDMHEGTINTNSLYDPSINETYLNTRISSDPTHPDLFQYMPPTKFGDLNDANGPFGYIYYDNTRMTVGKFKVKIPVRLEYRWGYIWSYVIGEIDTTLSN